MIAYAGEARVPDKRAWDIVDVYVDWSGWLVEGRTIEGIPEWITPATIEAATPPTLIGGIRAFKRVGESVPGAIDRLACRALFSDGQRAEFVLELHTLD